MGIQTTGKATGIREGTTEKRNGGLPLRDIMVGKEETNKRKMRGGQRKRRREFFNLSNVVFNEEEMNILDLGLKYAPDKNLNKFETYIDLQKFARRLNIKSSSF